MLFRSMLQSRWCIAARVDCDGESVVAMMLTSSGTALANDLPFSRGPPLIDAAACSDDRGGPSVATAG
jgi:hypothetical protein